MDISTLYINNEGTGIVLSATPSEGYTLQYMKIYYSNPSTARSTVEWSYEFTDNTNGTFYFEDGDGEVSLDKFLYVELTEVPDDEGDNQTKIIATFYTKYIMDKLMGCINELNSEDGDMCSSAKKYANLYLQFKAVSMAIRLGDFAKAEKYYYRFFSDRKTLARGGCNCHA